MTDHKLPSPHVSNYCYKGFQWHRRVKSRDLAWDYNAQICSMKSRLKCFAIQEGQTKKANLSLNFRHHSQACDSQICSGSSLCPSCLFHCPLNKWRNIYCHHSYSYCEVLSHLALLCCYTIAFLHSTAAEKRLKKGIGKTVHKAARRYGQDSPTQAIYFLSGQQIYKFTMVCPYRGAEQDI